MQDVDRSHINAVIIYLVGKLGGKVEISFREFENIERSNTGISEYIDIEKGVTILKLYAPENRNIYGRHGRPE